MPEIILAKKAAAEKIQDHIDALIELKAQVEASAEDGVEDVDIAFLLASAKASDDDIELQMGTSFDAITFGQILSNACTMSPNIVLGLMDGLMTDDSTRDAVTAAIVSMMDAMEKQDALETVKTEGNA